eukprot:CAMPEP_0118703670 /NCGR_PEP_ID=MMETSP0800-20121206/18714_1 /TAXON_ID=210618 ORGANISM="Striatella unipunctata, Strain CCMP2910" /NCGR_SAMPLE_ID=MMETSP0800 /ASSEMBLY_ACC=CAM_ASM_000638 /LENGTH=82 /DNA_ID=CAMNT_0006605285 /DNA_START=253 /DNA_END=501 /DNA_ORIENTATION=+
MNPPLLFGTTKLQATPFPQTDTMIAEGAATIDPSQAINSVVGAFIGTPLILLVPIGAGLFVGGLIVWFLVASSVPEVQDEDV